MTTIKLDKERRLLRTLAGMKLFEEKTGKSLLTGFRVEEMTIDDVYVLLWSLLIHEDKKLTLEEVKEFVENVDAEEIIQKIGEALQGKKS